jgi:hypothetical protein
MPTIAEDNDKSTFTKTFTTPTRRLVTEEKTDMPQFVQLLRRSLSITDSDVGAANQTTQRSATNPIVRIPTPAPRPLFTLVSAPTSNQMNTETDGAIMVSKSRPQPSAASASYSREGPISAQDHDGSRNRPYPERAADLAEVLRLLEDKERQMESKERHMESLQEQFIEAKEQYIEAKSDLRSITNMVQILLNQGQSATSAAVANQSLPNAPIAMVNNLTPVVNNIMISRNKKKKRKKKETNGLAPKLAAKTNVNKGKGKEIGEAENKLEQKSTKNLPLDLAPVRLSSN